ncbi:hypothetical protein E4U38_003327 [Claviceps purpurea]|nr:hypothetical protein E4U38_003327 [Claviceps purpurea]KAG6164857.1 hypothetical protein E4U51_004773 [Claviceps purpurea]KAG6195758.1 hypothetical protein E4U10_001578 [Claviceps purpurea]
MGSGQDARRSTINPSSRHATPPSLVMARPLGVLIRQARPHVASHAGSRPHFRPPETLVNCARCNDLLFLRKQTPLFVAHISSHIQLTPSPGESQRFPNLTPSIPCLAGPPNHKPCAPRSIVMHLHTSVNIDCDNE